MAAWRRAIELSLGDEDTAKLKSIAQSRTEPASRVERARILLAYREDPSFFAVGRALGLHHQTVQRCVERAVVEGPMAALDDRPRASLLYKLLLPWSGRNIGAGIECLGSGDRFLGLLAAVNERWPDA